MTIFSENPHTRDTSDSFPLPSLHRYGVGTCEIRNAKTARTIWIRSLRWKCAPFTLPLVLILSIRNWMVRMAIRQCLLLIEEYISHARFSGKKWNSFACLSTWSHCVDCKNFQQLTVYDCMTDGNYNKRFWKTRGLSDLWIYGLIWISGKRLQAFLVYHSGIFKESARTWYWHNNTNRVTNKKNNVDSWVGTILPTYVRRPQRSEVKLVAA